MSDEEKPFACSQPGCGMQFTNEDHLAVHMRKHDMSLALNLAQGGLSPIGLFTDQTPTPTKFLKNCEELGLFSELSKNPFDYSFKKAMDDPMEHGLDLPGTDNADLDTPQPQIPKIVIGGEEHRENRRLQDKPKDLSMSSIVPKKRKKFLTQSMPTSTTSEDEEEAVIGSSSTELHSSSENIVSNSAPVEVSSSISILSPQNVIHIAERLQSPPNGTGITENFQSPQHVNDMVDSFQSSQIVPQLAESSPTNVNDQIFSPQSVSSSGDSALIINENALTNSSPVIPSSSPGSINLTSVPVSTVSVQQKPAAPMMVQVLLQLPGGQVVPIQVPASNVASNQPVVPKPQPQPQQIQLVKPAVQPQPAVANLTQNSSTMFLAGNTLFQTGPNVQTVTPGGLIQNTVNTVPFTVKSPQQQTTTAQTGLQNILNQSANNSVLQSVLNQAATQSALRTILVSNKQQTGLQSAATTQMQTAQLLQNAITQNQATPKSQQKVAIPGSQSYTKQRLKAAIQQQTTPGSQKIFQGAEVKNEPQWSPGTNVSSPETGSSPGTSSMTYEQMMGDQTSDNNDADVKREKFLERNRAAAARCRQKRKHWVQTLESKADNLSNINNKLCGEIKKLRGEVASLKTMLLAHKECPVTMQQRAQGQLGTDTLSLGSDLNDITPIDIGDCTETETVSDDSAVHNHLSTITSGDQPITSLPVGLGMLQSIVQGDQVVLKPVSVITGANSLGLIPKIVNLDQSIQKTSSGS